MTIARTTAAERIPCGQMWVVLDAEGKVRPPKEGLDGTLLKREIHKDLVYPEVPEGNVLNVIVPPQMVQVKPEYHPDVTKCPKPASFNNNPVCGCGPLPTSVPGGSMEVILDIQPRPVIRLDEMRKQLEYQYGPQPGISPMDVVADFFGFKHVMLRLMDQPNTNFAIVFSDIHHVMEFGIWCGTHSPETKLGESCAAVPTWAHLLRNSRTGGFTIKVTPFVASGRIYIIAIGKNAFPGSPR